MWIHTFPERAQIHTTAVAAEPHRSLPLTRCRETTSAVLHGTKSLQIHVTHRGPVLHIAALDNFCIIQRHTVKRTLGKRIFFPPDANWTNGTLRMRLLSQSEVHGLALVIKQAEKETVTVSYRCKLYRATIAAHSM